MARVRVFAEDDIPAAVALFGRVYPELRWTSQAACEAYFGEMLFQNPWRDLELPSWVAEENGRIVGFQVVLPRRMAFHGRSLRVAVGCQFLVDPNERDSLTALRLAQAYLSGPQDLSLVDGANDWARRMWIGLGGTAPLPYNLHWTRPLRPVRYVLSLFEERARCLLPLTLALRPLGAFTAALSARLRPNRFHQEDAELVDDTLDAIAMWNHLALVMKGNPLQPEYDARSLAWLLDQAARKTRHGALRARAVLDGKRQLVGWYLYYAQAAAVNEVVQIAARDGWFGRVLQRLLIDAWRHGATAVRGRLDPRYVQELSDRHCWLRCHGPWTLIHSRRIDIAAAIHQGDAFISRLEGEWWLRFLGG